MRILRGRSLGWTRAMWLGAVAVPLAVAGLLCLATAPFFAPDEGNQSLRAMTLGHGQVIERMGTGEAGGDVDTGALSVIGSVDRLRMAWEKRGRDFHDRPWGAIDARAQRELSGERWEGRREFAGFGNTAAYPPFLYGPAVAGWSLGEAAGWTIFESLHLARMLNALAAVLLAYAAMRVCAVPPWFLLAALLLPSTVFLYASSSQDALVVPVAALAAALLTRPLAAGRDFTRGEFCGMVALLAVCATVRPPYTGLALVLFVPEAKRSWRGWLRAGGGCGVVLAVCAGWWLRVRSLGVDTADEANPALQRIFIEQQPLAAAHAILRGTMEAGADFVHRGLYVIGWNDLLPPHGLAVALWVYGGALLAASPGCRVRSWRGFAVLGLAVCLPLLGVSLAEYAIWTPPGLATVYGVQPRYWLPVVPFAMLLVGAILQPLAEFGGWRGVRPWVLRVAVCGLAAVTCTLPWVAAHAFYGMGWWTCCG